jgi:hypothetical protein
MNLKMCYQLHRHKLCPGTLSGVYAMQNFKNDSKLKLTFAALAMTLASSSAFAQSYHTSSLGPSGGAGGSMSRACGSPVFEADNSGTRLASRISKIVISSGEKIDSIRLEHTNVRSGTVSGATRLGGNGGSTREWVLSPDEQIIAINGWYDETLSSIAFTIKNIRTNKTRSIPSSGYVGGSGKTAIFAYSGPPGSFVSDIWGRQGELVDAIGACMTFVSETKSK